jgi:hypothetical protein
MSIEESFLVLFQSLVAIAVCGLLNRLVLGHRGKFSQWHRELSVLFITGTVLEWIRIIGAVLSLVTTPGMSLAWLLAGLAAIGAVTILAVWAVKPTLRYLAKKGKP